MMPFVLVSPSHSILKSKGFINIVISGEEFVVFFFLSKSLYVVHSARD